MKPKIFALYLPQFYEMKENNEWWGKGYTDWTAVKNSKALYPGHYQPQIPLNENYYTLTDVEVLKTQAEMATQYAVDGFCIYHYWSCGKMLMEKPTELLLAHPEIDIEYFLSWANHDFKKTWFNGDGHFLRKQEYGGLDDIDSHYAYLARFFRDQRYTKINNKPVLKIYNIYLIPDFEHMMERWTELAKKDGFNGLYLIANKSNTGMKTIEMQNVKYVDAVFVFEPLNVRTNGSNEELLYTYKRRARTWILRQWNRFSKSQLPEKIDYATANEMMLKRKPCGKQYYCIFPGWDNTPRYGGKGIVISGSAPVLFKKYAMAFYQRSKKEGNEILFVNAWNEWGESAHLEPDQKFGFQYLEAIREVVYGK
ncbi:hypothetical protein DWX10_27970 [Clostridium sp. AF18-27]|uniref:glycosyltransferase WbsX family protein n=1 Tax=Enterocloster lavalensis TaxID=460384 RepID=UPI000E4A0802|nr:glycoside hydrolase family 99-like domain-containing protein [Enterocloster lavalensis]MCB6346977.1 glycoside hydrolase family 99-like domain-containing protein [Enterocloster lavalensis]RHR45530.1 hypothetical protein DWX10_27970 [Clostridium sp. AF18-27]